MKSALQPPLVARNGSVIGVLGIARISKESQDELSLEDQEALYRRWLDEHVDGPYELMMVAGQGSGECLVRKEALLAAAEVETGNYDLVICEDLGRIMRRVHVSIFCETCVDCGTRLIALNDNVDTARDGWQLLAGFAGLRHELYNADTAKRIRRSLRNRFQNGLIVQEVIFGHIKPTDAKHDSQLHNDPAAEPVYAEIFRLLEGGASYSEVADWLNREKVPLPPYADLTRWTCQMVSRLIHNPLVKGLRVRNEKISIRVNKTGKRKCVPAPPGERLERNCPHLAFIEPARHEQLIKMLDERNAKYRRKGTNGIDPRKDVPKKRTVWPGQHLYCDVCGEMLVYGGHGQKDHLMCRGAKEYRCWNAITADGPLAAEKMISAIRTEIATLPDFDPVLFRLVEEECRRSQESMVGKEQELARRIAANSRELQNVTAAIRETGHSSSLLEELRRLEQEQSRLNWEQGELVRSRSSTQPLPTMAAVKELAFEAFDKLAKNSPEFGRLLRRLIPRIFVRPYRLCDGGHPVLRAFFTLNLAPLLPQVPRPEQLEVALQRSLVVDLFDAPQRETYRVPIMELTANGLTQKSIAWELGLTQPAVQHAVALSRKMAALGINDPYVLLTGPPEDYKRLRRHKHSRFEFKPQVGDNSLPPPAQN